MSNVIVNRLNLKKGKAIPNFKKPVTMEIDMDDVEKILEFPTYCMICYEENKEEKSIFVKEKFDYLAKMHKEHTRVGGEEDAS